ncbi:MAG: hypothetical protein COA91_03320 [Robiginitomaculum sp.]|nr:MAG: hypothetical protein COA91_03320 [Robiginitomaculum sp.]
MAHAQVDEVIVTGTRIRNSPGITLEKKGDFLLLEVNVENDSRELSVRLKEMNATIDNMIAAAKKHPDIILSLIDDNDFVRPLSKDTFYAGIRTGSRPDTSVATLKVKTNIPKKINDAFKLSVKLAEFVDNIDEVGRTKVINYDEVSVSIVNPYQYRNEVRDEIIAEINATTNALNGGYRVIVTGLDGPIKWMHSGDLNLAFYMNYSYKIIPDTLTNYTK